MPGIPILNYSNYLKALDSREQAFWLYKIFRKEHLNENLFNYLYDKLDLSVVKSISMLLDIDEGVDKLLPAVKEVDRNAILKQQLGLTMEPEYSLDSGDLERFVKNNHQFSVQLEDCFKYSLQQTESYVFAVFMLIMFIIIIVITIVITITSTLTIKKNKT